MCVQIFWVWVFGAPRRIAISDMTRSPLPHTRIWPGNAGEFKDVEGRMLERKSYDIFDSVEEAALRDADVPREALCDDDPYAARQLAGFPM